MLFESPPLSPSELLDDVHVGKMQLPDFQRPWKWDDERIISLLATVTLGYPLGVVMTLRSGGPVETTDSRGKSIARWYYLDIEGALDTDTSREDVILSAPANRGYRGGYGRRDRRVGVADAGGGAAAVCLLVQRVPAGGGCRQAAPGAAVA
jgi:hypothetical protein